MTGYARVRRRPKALWKSLMVPIQAIMAGLILIFSSLTNAAVNVEEQKIVYMYPTIKNNPVSDKGLFWLESAPKVGSLTLEDWKKILPDKSFVIGVPESHTVQAGLVGGAFRLIKKGIDQPRRPGGIVERDWKKMIVERQEKKQDPPDKGGKIQDVLIWERAIGDIKEKVILKAGEHFGDADSFDKFAGSIKDKLITNPDQLKGLTKAPPAPPKKKSFWDGGDSAQIVLGGGVTMAGLLSLLKILWPVVFAL